MFQDNYFKLFFKHLEIEKFFKPIFSFSFSSPLLEIRICALKWNFSHNPYKQFKFCITKILLGWAKLEVKIHAVFQFLYIIHLNPFRQTKDPVYAKKIIKNWKYLNYLWFLEVWIFQCYYFIYIYIFTSIQVRLKCNLAHFWNAFFNKFLAVSNLSILSKCIWVGGLIFRYFNLFRLKYRLVNFGLSTRPSTTKRYILLKNKKKIKTIHYIPQFFSISYI